MIYATAVRMAMSVWPCNEMLGYTVPRMAASTKRQISFVQTDIRTQDPTILGLSGRVRMCCSGVDLGLLGSNPSSQHDDGVIRLKKAAVYYIVDSKRGWREANRFTRRK